MRLVFPGICIGKLPKKSYSYAKNTLDCIPGHIFLSSIKMFNRLHTYCKIIKAKPKKRTNQDSLSWFHIKVK